MACEQVLEAAGITDPLILAVAYTARARSVSAVRQLREHFKDTPIFARALDSLHAAELRTAGAVAQSCFYLLSSAKDWSILG